MAGVGRGERSDGESKRLRGVEVAVLDACTVMRLVLPTTPDPKVTEARCGRSACHAATGEGYADGFSVPARCNFRDIRLARTYGVSCEERSEW